MNGSLSKTKRFLLELHKETSGLVHAHQSATDDGTHWVPFEATHFVFAYFVFNSIYSQFDWKESIEKNAYIPHPDTCRERCQYEKLCHLLSKNSTAEEFSNLIERHICGLFKALSKVDEGHNLSLPDQLWHPESLYGLAPDFDLDGNVHPLGISQLQIQSATAAWRNFVRPDLSDSSTYKGDLIALHELIYKIRCNIFHGRKKLVDMLDPEQRDRLTIYTAIILATNELFLKNIDTERVSDTQSGML